MGLVSVTPEEFVYTLFVNGDVRALAQRVADAVGIPADRPIAVEINEQTPLRRVRVSSLDPIALEVESGALEDPRRPRRLSKDLAEVSLLKALLRIRDRLDGSFADAPPDEKVSQHALSAWHTYAIGRGERLGFVVQRQRQLYDFRNRHQFSDASDAVFDRLWSAESMTWSELEGLSASVA
jgi:hypothetical protein